MNWSSRFSRSYLALAAALSLGVGCDRDPMVRVYDVEVASPDAASSGENASAVPGRAADPQTSPATPKRMLAAIVPLEASAVFLKLTGRPDALEKYREAVESMARSVALGGPEQVTFDVPEGWQRGPGGGFAAAKVSPPEMDGVDAPLTVTVLSRPAEDAAWQANLQSNLDRWRQQLNLPPVPVDQEQESNVRQVPAAADNLPIYLVDYVGTGSGGMRPPMMGSANPSMPQGGGSANNLTPAESGVAADKAVAKKSVAAASDVTLPKVSEETKSAIEFKLPPEWVDVGADSQSIRLVSLKTSKDPEAADVSFVLAGGEDASIVELWAAAVFGESQPTREQIDAILAGASPVTAANGVQGKLYFIAAPNATADADQPGTATHVDDPMILGVIFDAQNTPGSDAADATSGRRGFLKMTGKRGDVEANRQNFRSFVESLRW